MIGIDGEAWPQLAAAGLHQMAAVATHGDRVPAPFSGA